MATKEKPTLLTFGNDHPQMLRDVGQEQEDGSLKMVQERYRAEHLDVSVTSVALAAHALDVKHAKLALSTDNDRELMLIGKALGDDKQYAIAVQQMEHIIEAHSNGVKPAWIRCDSDAKLQKVLAGFYDVPEGEPEALLPNGGRDQLHNAYLTTCYMALTATATAPASGDTTLSGEITTAGGGLIRKAATYAHTAGTNTSTETATFTANGSDSLPVTVAADGLFQVSSAGTINFHTLLSSTATLSVSGDSLAVTHTPTIG